MEIDKILTLIDKVSESGLSEFCVEEGNLRVAMKKSAKEMAVTVHDSGTESVDETEGNKIVSPLVGTFYCAPSPEEEPYVSVGAAVKKGQTLGIIEAMKLMNEIESECDGVIAEILVKNGEMVEYGQPLFIIR